MFWGLIMEPGRCYTQTVKVSFHVSMAALDISNSTDEPAQVMCVFEGRNYLLCTLKKKDMIQCPLDLNFEAGSKVSFATNGKAHVHLTGYLTNFEEDEEEEEESETEVTEKKRTKKAQLEEPPGKKSKVDKDIQFLEEDSSDSDFDVNKLIEDDEEEEVGDEESEDVEEEEEDGAEEDSSSLSDEEIEEKPIPKQNGTSRTPQLKKSKEPEKTPKQKKQEDKKIKPKKTVLKGGVIVEDLRDGNGEPVKEGKFVHVYYEGRLKDNNKMFDSATKGPGFSFRVGKGEVIKGWDIGLVGMKVGGKRRITCPAKVAYGAKGSPPVIPPNATLVFDVEVKKIS